jgi:hypothetical protein
MPIFPCATNLLVNEGLLRAAAASQGVQNDRLWREDTILKCLVFLLSPTLYI